MLDAATTSSPEPSGAGGGSEPDDRLLADATRRVIRGVRVTAVDADARNRAAALLAEAAAVLEAEVAPGPIWQTGLTSLDQFDPHAPLSEIFPFSPALGRRNPVAPTIEVEVSDDKVVHGTATFTEPYGGPPFDTCHGGVIALVYDDIVGLAAMVGAGGGMTARLTVNYRRPTPLYRPITLRAWLEEHEGRKFVARGEMRLDGELLSEADGLFIQPRGFPPGTTTG